MSSQLSKQEIKYWLSFNQISFLGPVRFQRLLNYFPNLEAAFKSPFSELLSAGIEQNVAQIIVAQRLKINPDAELEKIERQKISVVTVLDKNYSKLLKEIYNPPPLLYYHGSLDLNNDFPLAVVGTRKISEYGRQVTQQIVKDLAEGGLTIISGLALGVDAVAHQSAVNCGGKTVAVLGSGLDLVYPISNHRLADKIIKNGGSIISEFPLGTPPYKSNFPQRNRIISGLSLGVVVTEAGSDSGALITAKYALEQNREIFAVPGNIYSQGSAGPHQLIKMGGQLITSAADILEVLNLQQAKNFKATKISIPETENEKKLLELLEKEPLHVDKLSQISRLDISVINSTLTVMEMKGLVKNLGGQKYVKTI